MQEDSVQPRARIGNIPCSFRWGDVARKIIDSNSIRIEFLIYPHNRRNYLERKKLDDAWIIVRFANIAAK